MQRMSRNLKRRDEESFNHHSPVITLAAFRFGKVSEAMGREFVMGRKGGVLRVERRMKLTMSLTPN